MVDPRYTFVITVSSHIIIQDEDGRVLMGKRPNNWEWAPGRWGLIGGKVYEKESLEDSIKRKTLQEIGFEVKPEGLYQMKQLIVKGKQAYMYFFVAKYNHQKLSGELAEYAWFDKADFANRPSSDFSEFFYKSMLGEFLSSEPDVLPISKLQSMNYIALGETEEYKKWFEGIINNKYNPGEIPDFQKWSKDSK